MLYWYSDSDGVIYVHTPEPMSVYISRSIKYNYSKRVLKAQRSFLFTVYKTESMWEL